MRPLILALLAVVALPGLAAAGAPVVRAVPARVVLGEQAQVEVEVEVEVEVPGGSGPVRAAASSGRLEPSGEEEGPVRRFRWKPPESRHPQVALLLFAVEVPEGPPELAVTRIPLLGRTLLPVSTDPGAEVEIEIEGARFGPVKADRRGRVQVEIEVPPGVAQARVLATRGALTTEQVVPLEVPAHAPLVALLCPSPLPASGGWLAVAGEGRVEGSELELAAEGARVEPRGAAPLLYRVSPLPGARTVSVEVRRRGGGGSARAEASVSGEALAAAVSAPRGGLALHLLAGGFFAGGANRGPLVALGASYPLPFWSGRLAAEVELGLRSAALEAQVEGHGELRSRVLAGPVLASARLRLLEGAAFSLAARAGAGLLPFQHEVSSELLPGFSERHLASMAFVCAQGAYRFGQVSALLEVRGEHGPARTPLLEARLGGLSASFGVRYEP